MSYFSKYKQIAIVSVITTLVLFLSFFSPAMAIAETPTPPAPPSQTPDNPSEAGTDPKQANASENPTDSDDDGLADSIEKAGWEIKINGEVTHVSSDPKLRDTDLDGLDDFEEFNGGTLVLSDTNILSIKTDPNNSDTDSDGVNDKDELSIHFTDPTKEDTDSDGLNDFVEITGWTIYINGKSQNVSSNPLIEDTDGDTFTDKQEKIGLTITSADKSSTTIPTNPDDVDTDGDGLTDKDERSKNTNPSRSDTDGDGLTDKDELSIHFTDPTEEDTDSDGLNDFVEITGWTIYINGESKYVSSDPTKEDTDSDGLNDFKEYDGLSYNQFGHRVGIPLQTDPTNPDTDEDEKSDKEELDLGCNPLLSLSLSISPDERQQCGGTDTDLDYLSDEYEKAKGYDENDKDSDNDDLPDGEEVLLYGTDPTQSDTDGDDLTDSEELKDPISNPNSADTDGDGLNDGLEVNEYLTDPNNPDTDNDGLKDGIEANGWDINIDGSTHTVSSDPKLIDTDRDGLNDFEEFNGGKLVLSDTKTLIIKTNPQNADTDSDGVNDIVEITAGTDPSSPPTDSSTLTSKGSEVEIGPTVVAPTSESNAGAPSSTLTSKGSEVEIEPTVVATTSESNAGASGHDTGGRESGGELSNTNDIDNRDVMPIESGTGDAPESGLTSGSITLIAALFIGIIATVSGIVIILWMKTRRLTSSPTPFRTISSSGPITEDLSPDVESLRSKIANLQQDNNYSAIPSELSRLSQTMDSFQIRNLTQELVALLRDISTPNTIDDNQREELRNSIVTTSEIERFNRLPRNPSYEEVFRYVIESNRLASTANHDADVDEQELKSQIERLIRACSSDIPDSSQRRIPLGLLNTCNTILDTSETGAAKVIAVQNVNLILELLYSWFFPNRRP